MGIKFYRSADKPKKIRKRFTQTRSWFRTLKWVAYHAHPLMIVGHPFKGGHVASIGFLQHPDMRRFGLNDASLYAPPRPDAWAQALLVTHAVGGIPSFGDFFATYFGGRSFSVSEPNASKALEGLKKCYENHSSSDPVSAC